MEYLVGILVLLFIAGAIALSSRLRELEQRLAEETNLRHEADVKLMRRVAELEAAPAAVFVPAKPAETAKAPEPVPPPVPAPPKNRVCQFCGRAISLDATLCYCGAATGVALPPPIPAPIPSSVSPSTPTPAPLPPPIPMAEPIPVLVPQISMRDRLRAKVGDQEWEAMVGGSWLNKLGVLILVIGIALLLGYEFTRVGPAGRVAIGLGTSLVMLIGGVLIERRPLYAIFGRGLIGGGWAALYFTTYAMHAVDAPRVIDNAYLAAVLLLAVACGMIAHSLKYKSQTVTGLAYFIAFATLALSESTPFSVLALIPLAASMLVLAYRFDWTRMAVFGLVATYATCASRPDTGAPLGSTQMLFGCYWLLFEAFDILRIGKGRRGFAVESLILPLNALGFLMLSLVKWQRVSPDRLYLALAAGAGLYLASSLLRILMQRPGMQNSDESTLQRMASGDYEGPITLSAALAALSIFRKAAGPWIGTGLLIEGEVLFLAGVRFGQIYLRQLAGAVFIATVARVLGVDVPRGGRTVIAGRAWITWSPVTLASAAVFYCNRAFFRRSMEDEERSVYSWAATALISLVIGFETHLQYVGVAWLLFATALFEIGFRLRKTEFLYQSYAVGVIGTAACVLFNVGGYDPTWTRVWIPVAIAAAIHFAVALRIRNAVVDGVSEAVRWVTSASCVAFLSEIVWMLAPGDYLGLAWLVLGAVIFELGIRAFPSQFKWLSYAVSAGAVVRLVYFDVVLASKDSAPAVAISLGAAALVGYAMSVRVFGRAKEGSEDLPWYRDANCAAATLFVLMLAWLKLPVPTVALAWAIVSLVILESGFHFSLPRFRAIGNLTGCAVFGRLFMANFTNLGDTFGISHRMLSVLPIAISQYYIWWRYKNAEVPPAERSWTRAYLYAPAILIFVLMRFELGRSLAVVGWALFCVVLFRAGLALRIADLRWQSFAIALAAFWRCWDTNFYIPESLAGLPGRVVAGSIVIACFYAAQLLAPRDSSPNSNADGLSFLDRHARTFYSLLGSILLAVMLFYEVSGGVLTMAWGAEALLVLAAGFPLRDRVQRLSGLFLFLVCVLKLFFYDLRQLETVNRILSFIVLGLILVSVSWIYTRFRDRIQRYL